MIWYISIFSTWKNEPFSNIDNFLTVTINFETSILEKKMRLLGISLDRLFIFWPASSFPWIVI